MQSDIRDKIIKAAESQLGKPYQFGYQIKDLDNPNPDMFDCSEFTRWCYHQAGSHLPDGSSVQYEYTQPTQAVQPGDLGFFGDAERGIYHVGIVYSDTKVIEARGAPYNKVIFRPFLAWTEWKNFKGWRTHPELL